MKDQIKIDINKKNKQIDSGLQYAWRNVPQKKIL